MQGVPKIPYFQTSRYRVAAMVELADPKPHEKAADLGSGDGRIVIAFAKTGIEMHGYEIDETLRKQSLENIKKELELCHSESLTKNLPNEEKILHSVQDDKIKIIPPTIHNTDFWAEDLSQYDIICCYPMPTIMGRLEKKLQTELRPGARVVLNYFPFKHWKLKQTKDNIFLYVK